VPSAVELQFLQASGSHSLPALRQGQRSVRHCVLQLQPGKLQECSEQHAGQGYNSACKCTAAAGHQQLSTQQG
jgi:hypothetical protein